MANADFILKLSSFVNNTWPAVKVGHSINAVDDRYPCANPDGPVDNSECDDDDPLCNCPCQELKPTREISAGILGDYSVVEEEPTDEELQEALESIKECDLIESELNEDWLGCLWNNQDHPSSCNCPCRGEKFGEYMDYTRTYATYWNTPENTPLWRNAQMFLIKAQTAQIVLNGDLSLRPGTLIKIVNKLPGAEDPNTRRFSGRWMVTTISHIIQGESHRMMIGLSRDSSPIEPNESRLLGWFESAWDFFTG
tara:strand:- start:732 stop:1490 length:759 start_codon:yes stop_codon:yes gene_type:complete